MNTGWTLLFLLLPVAALSGWWLGRRNVMPSQEARKSAISAEYFKGLNYLLNEQSDKAIDVFVKMLEVDADTVETHLALGNLFRRRGEGDRAIRIHQNLIARPALSKQQKLLALFELGQDYLRAGMLGRAESLFQEVIEQGGYRHEANEKLLDIYQQEKDWEKAILAAQRVESLSGKSMKALIAQFCCELAEQLLENDDLKNAGRMVKRAQSADHNSVRASMLQARIDRREDRLKNAIKVLKQVEIQDPRYLPEAIKPLMDCYREMDDLDEAERYLNFLLYKHGGITPLLALVDILRQKKGDQVAAERITAFLRERPSVRGLDRLIELNLESSEGSARENLLILKELTRKLLEDKAVYRCSNCGFKGKTLHWNCPGCRQWGTMERIQGVVGE